MGMRWLAAGLAVALWMGGALEAGAAGGGVDVHMHLTFPLLEKQHAKRNKGGTPPGDAESVVRELLGMMDAAGVDKAIVMPPPQVREQTLQQKKPASTLELADAVKQFPGRLALGGGGDTLNGMIHGLDASAVAGADRAAFEKEAARLAAMGVKVFGEMSVLHLSMNEQHVFEEVSPEHPLFLLLADCSAKYGIPVDVHMEAVPRDLPLPQGLMRASSRNPEVVRANVSAFQRLLMHNPDARFVWQHIGWDNIGHMTVELLDALLESNPNLYMALRVEARTQRIGGGGPMPNRIVDEQGRVKPEWFALFQKYPDRFVIGSDEFIGGIGGKSASPQSFDETWAMLRQLPPDLAAKIGRENAIRIYNLR